METFLHSDKRNYAYDITRQDLQTWSNKYVNDTITEDDKKLIASMFFVINNHINMKNQASQKKMNQQDLDLYEVQINFSEVKGKYLFKKPENLESKVKGEWKNDSLMSNLSNRLMLGYTWSRGSGNFKPLEPNEAEARIAALKKKAIEEENDKKIKENNNMRNLSINVTTEEENLIKELLMKCLSKEAGVSNSSEDLNKQVFEKIVFHSKEDTVKVRQTYLYKSTDMRLQSFIEQCGFYKAVDLIDTLLNIGLDYFNIDKVEFEGEELTAAYDKLRQGRSKRKNKKAVETTEKPTESSELTEEDF